MGHSNEITCIFCGLQKNQSKEHVIPQSLGGNLVIYDVCIDCNSILGSVADSEFDRNSYIAAAYKKLGWQEELKKIVKKADNTAVDMQLLIPLKLRLHNDHEFQIVPQELEDGSRIFDEEGSSSVISKMIERRKEKYSEKGLKEDEIEFYKQKLIKKYEEAEPNTEINSPELGFRIIMHSSELKTQVEFSNRIPLRGISKIGYELLFFVIGHKCLDPRFEIYRQYAIGKNRIPPICQLFSKEKPLPFFPIHQLYLVEQNGNLICGIKLFRGYAWGVCFGSNDIDAFKDCCELSGRKVNGIGIQMDLEKNVNTFWLQTESGKWDLAGEG